MKLQTVTCYAVEIPAKDGSYAMSRDRVLRSFPSTVVRVTAEDGASGFAEARSLGGNYFAGFPGSIPKGPTWPRQRWLSSRPRSIQATSSGPDALSARTCPSPTRKPDHQGPDRNSTTAPFSGAMLPAWASMLTRTCSGRRFSSYPADCT